MINVPADRLQAIKLGGSAVWEPLLSGPVRMRIAVGPGIASCRSEKGKNEANLKGC
jgi:hypothetical protein